jgi:hypothetical protein
MWLVVWCAVPRTVAAVGAVGCDCGAIPGAMLEFCVQTCVGAVALWCVLRWGALRCWSAIASAVL